MADFGDIVSTEPRESFYLPSGVIMPYGGTSNTPPDGWVFCNGANYGTATYPNLYAVIGTAYGGSGSNFSVPDLRRRMVLGFGTTASGTAVGVTGGSFDHTHSGPSHTHNMGNHTHSMQNHSHGMEHTHGVTVSGVSINTTTFSPGLYTNAEAQRQALEDVGAINAPKNFYLVKNINYHSAFNHYHPINIPNLNGSTGGASSGNTGPPSSANTGTPSDNNTGASGTDQTGSSNPPYMTLQYIIKT
jgi:microcystin-dependent protein